MWEFLQLVARGSLASVDNSPCVKLRVKPLSTKTVVTVKVWRATAVGSTQFPGARRDYRFPISRHSPPSRRAPDWTLWCVGGCGATREQPDCRAGSCRHQECAGQKQAARKTESRRGRSWNSGPTLSGALLGLDLPQDTGHRARERRSGPSTACQRALCPQLADSAEVASTVLAGGPLGMPRGPSTGVRVGKPTFQSESPRGAIIT